MKRTKEKKQCADDPRCCKKKKKMKHCPVTHASSARVRARARVNVSCLARPRNARKNKHAPHTDATAIISSYYNIIYLHTQLHCTYMWRIARSTKIFVFTLLAAAGKHYYTMRARVITSDGSCARVFAFFDLARSSNIYVIHILYYVSR